MSTTAASTPWARTIVARVGGRPAAVLIVSALLLSSCGGDSFGTTSTAGSGPDSPIDVGVVDASISLLERWRDRPSFYGVMAALDAGYSAAQVIAGADDLDPDGSIPGMAPERGPSGLLSRTGPNGLGRAAAGRVLAAPAGPGTALGPETEEPDDRYVENVGAWLSEVGDQGQQAISRAELEPAEAVAAEAGYTETDFVGAIVFLTLQLASRGYSERQIIEGMLSFDVDFDATNAMCWHVAGPGGSPIAPDHPPTEIARAICGPFPASDSTTTSTGEEDPSPRPPDAGPAPGEDAVIYTGTLQPAPVTAAFLTVGESHIEIVVDAGAAAIAIDVTFEAMWVPGDDNNEPCISTERFQLAGSGPVLAGEITADLAVVDLETLAIAGCESEEGDDGETIPFRGTITGGVIEGAIDPYFTFTATGS